MGHLACTAEKRLTRDHFRIHSFLQYLSSRDLIFDFLQVWEDRQAAQEQLNRIEAGEVCTYEDDDLCSDILTMDLLMDRYYTEYTRIYPAAADFDEEVEQVIAWKSAWIQGMGA